MVNGSERQEVEGKYRKKRANDPRERKSAQKKVVVDCWGKVWRCRPAENHERAASERVWGFLGGRSVDFGGLGQIQ